MSDWERSEFETIWASAGVYLADGASNYDCPRHSGGQTLWIDSTSGAFGCHVCRLMGHGVRSLRPVADLLVVRVSENEKFFLTCFGELGHCPRIKPLAMLRGRQLRLHFGNAGRAMSGQPRVRGRLHDVAYPHS